ncbi:hypothetical protein N7532_007575 [Penicillium argentinense]|uniref:EF-hand domain-containing protein n=1 Tax=Penicillium argentinense TaxID=1131581 RepID=A0A9W9F872_9EURO|nr:uncharacterized protein N7532_007575 [Penicillium argentinense]KAJ5095284.1 hypothetical protein N7532_007575 [Penicillium argentinense]
MGFKTEKSPAEILKTVKKKLTPEQKNNAKITIAAIYELFTETPEDVYYSSNMIQSFLGLFIVADRNLDGHVELHELIKATDDMKLKDGEDIKEFMKKFFTYADISEDKKLSLAEWFILGFLSFNRNNDYPFAERLEDS